MAVLAGIVAGIVLLALMGIIGFGVGTLAMAGYRIVDVLEPASIFVVLLAGMFLLFVFLAYVVAVQFVAMFYGALVARALGYWTCQFDVPQWRGQDDPMPFETTKG